MKKKERVLLIIPAYNEEQVIKDTCDRIKKYNKENKTSYDFVVINDGSKDKTEEILIKNKLNHVCLISNLGIGGAVQTGYKYALENNYDIAIQFDGDGQHLVEYVEDIIKPIINGDASMVIGSRFIDAKISDFKSSRARRIGISLISKVIYLKTRAKILDTTSGFRAANKEIINLFAHKYPVEYPEPISTVEVLMKKYRVKEVPVKMRSRVAGVSSISSFKSAYYMVNVILSILAMGKGNK